MEPTRILFICPNGENVGANKEEDQIRAHWNQGTRRDAFRFESCHVSSSLPEITQKLAEFYPQIVHFSCHGDKNGLYITNIGDSSHKPLMLNSEELYNLLHPYKNTLECVVLNACYSQKHAEYLHKQGIPYVIGMNEAVNPGYSIVFSIYFYQYLFNAHQDFASYKIAFDAAKNYVGNPQFYKGINVPAVDLVKKNIPVIFTPSPPPDQENQGSASGQSGQENQGSVSDQSGQENQGSASGQSGQENQGSASSQAGRGNQGRMQGRWGPTTWMKIARMFIIACITVLLGVGVYFWIRDKVYEKDKLIEQALNGNHEARSAIQALLKDGDEQLRTSLEEYASQNVYAQNILGADAYQARTYDDAFAWYQMSANQGDAEGQAVLGNCYYNGYGAPINYDEAFHWYQLSADQGDAEGQAGLGDCYYNGYGASINYGEAFQLYRKSADQGNSEGQNGIGNCYFNGVGGVKQDFQIAFQYFEKSADQGNRNGQNALGWCYEHGYGCKQDLEKARDYYQLAIAQGNADAPRRLNRLLENHPELKSGTS